LDEEDFVNLRNPPVYRTVSGFKIAEGYYYHLGHAWARFEHGGLVRVGFDDFMVKLFGLFQKLDLPPLGAALRQNEVGWSFGRNGDNAAVLSPVTGTVLTTNYRMLKHPEIISQDPYQDGWLFMIEPELPKKNLRRLYADKECFQWIENETKKLMRLIGPQYERLAATGGEIINDLFGSIPVLEWDTLVQTFLHTEKK
jgi:glycine cleavage system H lipoate-binding protein